MTIKFGQFGATYLLYKPRRRGRKFSSGSRETRVSTDPRAERRRPMRVERWAGFTNHGDQRRANDLPLRSIIPSRDRYTGLRRPPAITPFQAFAGYLKARVGLLTQ